MKDGWYAGYELFGGNPRKWAGDNTVQPKTSSWTFEIDYTTPVRLFIWLEADDNQAGIVPIITAKEWERWPAPGMLRDKGAGSVDTLVVYTKYFDTGTKETLEGLFGRFVGGVVSGSSCSADNPWTTTMTTTMTGTNTTTMTTTTTFTTSNHLQAVFAGTIYINMTDPCSVLNEYNANTEVKRVFQSGIANAMPRIRPEHVEIIGVTCVAPSSRRLQGSGAATTPSPYASYPGVLVVKYEVSVPNYYQQEKNLLAQNFVFPADPGNTAFATSLAEELAKSQVLVAAGLNLEVFHVWSDLPSVSEAWSDPSQIEVTTTTAAAASGRNTMLIIVIGCVVAVLTMSLAGILWAFLRSAPKIDDPLPPSTVLPPEPERGDRVCI